MRAKPPHPQVVANIGSTLDPLGVKGRQEIGRPRESIGAADRRPSIFAASTPTTEQHEVVSS